MSKFLIISTIIIFLSASYFIYSSISYEQNKSDLDRRFDSIVEELEDYGGAMIVSYNEETGEITGKRRVGEPRQFGVMTITEEEYENSNKEFPERTRIVDTRKTVEEVISGDGIRFNIGGKN